MNDNKKWYVMDINLQFGVEAKNEDEVRKKVNEILDNIVYDDIVVNYDEVVDIRKWGDK